MTAEAKTYNGWTNYETWAVNLWMDNEQGSQRHWASVAQECWDDAEADRTFSREERATLDLAERLENEIESQAPDLGASMFSDLLSAALSEVDWHEISEHLIADVEKADPEEDEEEDEDEAEEE